MFSVKFPKESIYYEITNEPHKYNKEKSSNSIIINYTRNNPINYTKINTVNNYQILKSAKNLNQPRNQVMFSKKFRNIKNNTYSIKDKFLNETNKEKTPVIEKKYHQVINSSPMLTLNKSLNVKLLSDKMNFDSLYYNNDNSILKQKLLDKLDDLKKQKLFSPQNTHKENYITNNNILLRTAQNSCIRSQNFFKFKRCINENSNNYSLDLTGYEKKIDNKSYSEKRSKYYNFFESSKKPELFRNLEDLEKKSIEISKRKMIKKNSNKYIFGIKKDNNLKEIKKSLDNIRAKIHLGEEKSKLNPDSNSRNKYISINKTINNQNSIQALYHISKIKAKINKNNSNTNNSINKIKKVFIIKRNNERKNNNEKINKSPYVKKNYIEDSNPLNIVSNSIDNSRHIIHFHKDNNNKKSNKNILPSISEENKNNFNNLVYIIKRIIENKKIALMSDFLKKIKSSYKTNSAKRASNFKYSKKIIPKKINKVMKVSDYKNNNIIKLLSNEKQKQNKFSIFKDFGKVKKLINNLRINLIRFSLNKHSHS